MFRITDICAIALQIEQNGELTYHQASQIAIDPEFSRLFEWMAAEERGHVQWFQQFSDDRPLPSGNEDLEAMGRNLLQEMIAKETFSLDQDQLVKTEKLSELLEQSINFEQDTILFYSFLSSLIEDAQTVTQLDEIISEEKKHVEILNQMLSDITKAQ